jgi:hypothetical protein
MEMLSEHSHHEGHHNQEASHLLMNNLRFSIDGETPLHFFATNEHFLHSYMAEIQAD